jgi:hypothetical protein
MVGAGDAIDGIWRLKVSLKAPSPEPRAPGDGSEQTI